MIRLVSAVLLFAGLAVIAPPSLAQSWDANVKLD